VSELLKPYEFPDVSELFKAVQIPDVSELFKAVQIPDVSNLLKPYEFPDVSDLFNVARDRVRAYTTAFDERWDELQEAGELLDLASEEDPRALLAPAR